MYCVEFLVICVIWKKIKERFNIHIGDSATIYSAYTVCHNKCLV